MGIKNVWVDRERREVGAGVYLAETTSVPAAKSPSLWLRFETRMASPAGSPPKSSGLASTTLTSVRTRARRQPQRPPDASTTTSPWRYLPGVRDQSASQRKK